MTPTVRQPFKSLAAALFASAAVLAASGCNFSATPQAATVGNVTITPAELDSTLAGVTADTGYLCSLSNGFQAAIRAKGAGDGTYDTRFTDLVLSYMIDAQLARDATASKGIKLTPLAGTLAAEQWRGLVGSSVTGCTESPPAVLAALPTNFRDALYTLYAAIDSLVAKEMGIGSLTPAGIDAYLATHRNSALLDCLNFIQVTTLAKAQTVEALLGAGATFGSVASKYSVASSDSAGCVAPAQLPAALQAALSNLQIGGVTKPVAFQSDYLVLNLTARTPEKAADVESQIASSTRQQFANLVTSFDGFETVRVDPAYGTWSTTARAGSGTPGSITPPTGPPAQVVPSPAAAVGPAVSAGSSAAVPPGAG